MPRITLALATILSFMVFTPVAAQDGQKGVDGYNAGDYKTALKEWRPPTALTPCIVKSFPKYLHRLH
jgi:hypothetical protein